MLGWGKGEGRKSRADGYVNLLNKYGTKDDVSEHYRFESGVPVTDVELTLHYEENGLFSKIIDIPADDAVSSGFSYGADNAELERFINDSLDELDFEEKASTALKWSRLYGGALIVMVIDDGGDIEDPLDWDGIRGIDDLLVFERPLITPDYNSIYEIRPEGQRWSKFGMPEYYTISPVYGGTFRVHESRCLLFRNGNLPQYSSRAEYRFFGMPEYARVHKALQEAATSHGNGVKLLDRAVQAIYKMKNLENLLETEYGEELVLKRLRIIDLAKGIINSIAIDAEGEDYDYKSITFSGIKDIIDATCNMLSAVTNIPQTKLFGRSPAGENATGKSDMENYYTFVGKIQKMNLKRNMGTLIDVILAAGKGKGKFEEIPDYTLEFKPLWSLSETEQAGVDQAKAAVELTRAQTAQVYVDMQALDASEVRKWLAENGDLPIGEILEEDEDWGALEEFGRNAESDETAGTALSAEAPGREPVAMELDAASDPKWITTRNGKHIEIGENGELLKGNPAAIGGGDRIENEGKTKHKSVKAERTVDEKAIKEYSKEIEGLQTVKGVVMKKFSAHAAQRLEERKAKLETVKDVLATAEITYPGNIPNTLCYQKGRWRIIASKDGTVVSVVDIGEEE